MIVIIFAILVALAKLKFENNFILEKEAVAANDTNSMDTSPQIS